MKKYLPALALALILCALSSCMKEEEYPSYYQTMATVQSDDSNVNFMSDAGILLVPTNEFYWSDSIKNGERVLLYFRTTADETQNQWEITVISYSQVYIFGLTQFDTAAEDSTYNQELYNLQSGWIGKGYLNLLFSNYVTKESKYSFDLVRIREEDTTQGNWPLVSLHLHHNAASISPLVIQDQIISYDLADLRQEFAGQDTLFVKFCYKIDKNYNYTFTYALK